MDSSKKLKKYSAGMSWAFSKRTAYLLALFFLPLAAVAETGVINAVGYGKESPEAIASLLRTVVSKYFREEPEELTKNILQNEILPNASSFVQSYKILEGGKGQSVSLSANVDLDIIRALLTLTPAVLGEAKGVKALVVAKGARLPDGTQPTKAGVKAIDPYSVLDAAARDRLARRQFSLARLSDDEMKALGENDDVASLELLRGLGARAGARLALGISSRYENFENENSHNKEQRIVVSATLVDVKTGLVMGKSSANVTEPKGRKDQYAADLQRSFAEEARDLFHEAFVLAGRKLAKIPGQADISLVRVRNPANAQILGKFRLLLETIKGVKSVAEYSARRGAFDFAISPAQKAETLAKAVKALEAEDFVIKATDPAVEEDEREPSVAVTLAPKEVSVGNP